MLPKETLLDRFLQGVSLSGWHAFTRNQTHPYLIDIWLGEESRSVRLYIWSMTPGGPSTVRPEGEFRIQITGVDSPLVVTPGVQTLLFGWSEDVNVFAAFDVRRHLTFGRSPSIQVRLGTLEEANRYGYCFQTRGNRETVVAFAPDQLLNYVLHQRELHTLARNEIEARVVAIARGDEDPVNLEEFNLIPEERQGVIAAVHRWTRERTFRDRVLRAYRRRCSVCHLQLQIVQAAHIVPVHIPGSTDSTNNGLALCPSHHAAYDGGLLGVAPNYHIIVNQARLDQLRVDGLQGGEESILQRVCNLIMIPENPSDQPLPEFLELGMQVRGWGGVNP